MTEIANCSCGQGSAVGLGEGGLTRRYCLNTASCGLVGAWQPTYNGADAAWNALMGEPSVTWITEYLAVGDGFVRWHNHGGGNMGDWALAHFGDLADMLKAGKCELKLTATRVKDEAHPDTTVPAWCDTDGDKECPGFSDGEICVQSRCPHCTDSVAAMADKTTEEPAVPGAPLEEQLAASRAAHTIHQRIDEQEANLEKLAAVLATVTGDAESTLDVDATLKGRVSELYDVTRAQRDRLDKLSTATSTDIISLATRHDALGRVVHRHRANADAHNEPPAVPPAPDVEPDCPNDCLMIEFQRPNGTQMGVHAIQCGYEPTCILLEDEPFYWNVHEGRTVYRSRGEYPQLTPGRPLRPEASDV